MGFQWFSMVANHWSDDGMVTINRSGLLNTVHGRVCTGNIDTCLLDIITKTFENDWILRSLILQTSATEPNTIAQYCRQREN